MAEIHRTISKCTVFALALNGFRKEDVIELTQRERHAVDFIMNNPALEGITKPGKICINYSLFPKVGRLRMIRTIGLDVGGSYKVT
ncbi:MAG: hypothetical protein PHS02_03905, partial [Candidatus ainarchaeum sp.]|nr:hypothetical protein [Candidatus ainarchaeum sp.]